MNRNSKPEIKIFVIYLFFDRFHIVQVVPLCVYVCVYIGAIGALFTVSCRLENQMEWELKYNLDGNLFFK